MLDFFEKLNSLINYVDEQCDTAIENLKLIKNELDRCDKGLEITSYNNLRKNALQNDFNGKINNCNKVIEYSNDMIKKLQALTQKVDPIISEFREVGTLPQIPNTIALNSQVSNLSISN